MEGWRNLRLLFPNAKILDSSLEAFTAEAWRVRGEMEVVTAEVRQNRRGDIVRSWMGQTYECPQCREDW
jgi:hypothetical protein